MVGKDLDPIFAQGSAPGRSAIAVVRLSGKLPASLYEELKINKEEIKSLGGLEKLLEEFKKRMEEQEKRHEGGNKWM